MVNQRRVAAFGNIALILVSTPSRPGGGSRIHAFHAHKLPTGPQSFLRWRERMFRTAFHAPPKTVGPSPNPVGMNEILPEKEPTTPGRESVVHSLASLRLIVFVEL